VVKNLQKLGTTTASAVRDARGATNKKLRGLKLDKVARPDDLRKAEGEMEKITKEGTSEVDRLIKSAERAILNA
jgi:ribosome recycling factor